MLSTETWLDLVWLMTDSPPNLKVLSAYRLLPPRLLFVIAPRFGLLLMFFESITVL